MRAPGAHDNRPAKQPNSAQRDERTQTSDMTLSGDDRREALRQRRVGTPVGPLARNGYAVAMRLAIDGHVEKELAALNSMPLAEMRWRMAVVTELSGTAASCSQKTQPYRLDGATRYAWNDSGGTSQLAYFTDDGRALILIFETDHTLNIGFGDQDHAYLRAMLRGVPTDLRKLTEVPGQDAGDCYPDLGLTEPDGRRLLAATGVFWYDGQQWHHATEGMLEACELEGTNLIEEPSAMSSVFFAGEEFTPEHYFTSWFGHERLTPERSAHLRELIHGAFERHPR